MAPATITILHYALKRKRASGTQSIPRATRALPVWYHWYGRAVCKFPPRQRHTPAQYLVTPSLVTAPSELTESCTCGPSRRANSRSLAGPDEVMIDTDHVHILSSGKIRRNQLAGDMWKRLLPVCIVRIDRQVASPQCEVCRGCRTFRDSPGPTVRELRSESWDGKVSCRFVWSPQSDRAGVSRRPTPLAGG